MRMQHPMGRIVAAFGIGLLTMAAAAPTARAQVKLEYKFPEGQTLRYKVHANIDQIMTIGGQEVPTNIDQKIVVSRSVGKRNAEGGLPVREKIESLRMEMGLPMDMSFTFDSTDPDAEVDNPLLQPAVDALKIVKDIDYTVVLDAKNKVKAVEGAEKLREKAEKLKGAIRDQIRARLSSEKLKTEFEQSHGDMPDVLARPGETWERTVSQSGGGADMVMRKRYEYVGTEKKGDKTLHKISVKTIDFTLKPDDNPDSPAKVSQSDLKVESSDGTILFDREAGRVVESHEKTHVKGTMTLTANEMDIPGELDITIDTTTEYQPEAE